jgi:UDP-glucose 4-epimerase
MVYLVTGATGFIGRNLVNYLISHGKQVIVLKCSNEDYCFQSKNVISFNINDLDTAIRLESVPKIDVLYHLAWVGVDSSKKNDFFLQNKNILMAGNVLNFAKSCGCKRVIIPGSASEFGSTERIIDGHGEPSPVDVYSETKVKVRDFAVSFCKKNDLLLCWPLITSLYGPGREGTNLLYTAIKTFSEDKVLHCTKLEQDWDFLFIDDAIKALALLGMCDVRGGLYPLGSGVHHKLSWYINYIKTHYFPNAVISMDVPYKTARLDNQVMDIQKIVTETGYSPSFTFETGIELWCRFLGLSKRL